jgi:hypothetical protein
VEHFSAAISSHASHTRCKSLCQRNAQRSMESSKSEGARGVEKHPGIHYARV